MSLDDLKFTRVNSFDDALDFRAWLSERREWLAIDTETSGLNKGNDVVRLVQFGDAQHGWAIDYRDWRGMIKQSIEEYRGRIVAHNLLYDSGMLKKDGIVIPQHLAHDTLVMAFLNDPGARADLKGNAAKYVDKRATLGKGALEQFMHGGGWKWRDVPTDAEPYWLYGALDTCLTAMLAEVLYPLTGGGQFYEAYELNLAVIHVLRDGELAGLQVDEEYRSAAARQLRRDLDELAARIPVKPSSDVQVRKHLLDLGCPLVVTTDSGALSVDKHVLRHMEVLGFEVAGLIRSWRSKARELGSYIEKFAEVTAGGLAVNGILRPNTHPVGGRDESGKSTGTRTGRLSVTEPPLQTLPRGRVVRDAIIARPGHRILQADFAGMEMRALASLAQEEAMLAAYDRGEDMHNFVAASVYGEGFTKQQRATAKNAGFATIYGAGLAQFAATAQITLHEAESFLDKYHSMFPRVTSFMEETIAGVMEEAGGRSGTGHVTLPDGTRLPVPGDKPYVAVNYKIQGGTAVVAKRKMVELANAGLLPFFRLAVHDEFLFEVPNEHVPAAREIIRRVMPDGDTYPGVTLEIDQDEVERWGQHYRGDYPKYLETEDPPWLSE